MFDRLLNIGTIKEIYFNETFKRYTFSHSMLFELIYKSKSWIWLTIIEKKLFKYVTSICNCII